MLGMMRDFCRKSREAGLSLFDVFCVVAAICLMGFWAGFLSSLLARILSRVF